MPHRTPTGNRTQAQGLGDPRSDPLSYRGGGTRITRIPWSRRPDSNRGPFVYKTNALPLSYGGRGRRPGVAAGATGTRPSPGTQPHRVTARSAVGVFGVCCKPGWWPVAPHQGAAQSVGTTRYLSTDLARRDFLPWTARGSNPLPPHCQRGALPSELAALTFSAIVYRGQEAAGKPCAEAPDFKEGDTEPG